MKTRQNRKSKPELRPWDDALDCPLPSGEAPHFNQLEALRRALFDFLRCMTTDPFMDDPVWVENEIQRGADRLKEIRVRRARALKDARSKGGRVVYGKEKAGLVYVCGPTQLSNQSPTSALLQSGGPCFYGDGTTAILRSDTWLMPRGSLRTFRYQPSDSGATRGVFSGTSFSVSMAEKCNRSRAAPSY